MSRSRADRIVGRDIFGATVWEAIRIAGEWFGTGQQNLIVTFTDLDQCIDFFIGAYPGTQGIDATIDDRYNFIDVAAATRKQVVNIIVTKQTEK